MLKMQQRLDGRNIPFEVLEAVDFQQTPISQDKLSHTEYCCLQSHKKALVGNHECLTILEDDVIFHHDFTNRFKSFMCKVPDWDGIMWGCVHMTLPKFVNPQVVQCTYTLGAYAFTVKPHVAAELIAMYEVGDKQSDVCIGELQSKYKFYAPTEGLIGVEKDWSDVKQMVYNPKTFYLRDNFRYRD